MYSRPPLLEEPFAQMLSGIINYNPGFPMGSPTQNRLQHRATRRVALRVALPPSQTAESQGTAEARLHMDFTCGAYPPVN